MAAVTIFRGLILAALAVLVATIAAGVLTYFNPPLPAAVESYLAEQNAGTMANVFSEANWGTQIAVGITFVLYLIAYLTSLIGLLRFRGWARWLFIIVVGLMLVFIISGGTTLSTPIDALVSTIGAMVDGAILTLLFIEPVRARFRDEPIAPQVPLGPP
jgi:hypothetical protein